MLPANQDSGPCSVSAVTNRTGKDELELTAGLSWVPSTQLTGKSKGDKWVGEA